MTPANDNTAPDVDALRPAEYDAMIVAYRPFMRRYGSRLGVEKCDMDEFIQDVMVVAFERYHHYKPDCYAFTTWLSMLVRNTVDRRFRHSRAKKRYGFTVDVDKVSIAVQPSQEDVADLAKLAKALEAMPPGREKAILLRHVAGEEFAEIGRDYGISRERVRQLGWRARSRLMAALAEPVALADDQREAA